MINLDPGDGQRACDIPRDRPAASVLTDLQLPWSCDNEITSKQEGHLLRPSATWISARPAGPVTVAIIVGRSQPMTGANATAIQTEGDSRKASDRHARLRVRPERRQETAPSPARSYRR